jgi:chorismate-pyruvate lyase
MLMIKPEEGNSALSHTTLKIPELFKASGYEGASAEVNWPLLPPFLRVLLSTDGTVTKSLEAYFWEPVAVIRQRQCELEGVTLGSEFTLHEPLWQRDVSLVGQHTGCCYGSARSYVRFTLLPKELKRGLEQDELGIGGVIRALGLETYRKIVAVGQEPHSQACPTAVWRTYQLYYQGQVLMRITETFDLSVFV